MPTMSLRVDREQTELARRVRNFLHKQPDPQLQSLQVEVRHDVVVVRGSVANESTQRMASACCQRVAGVRRVVNETTVCSA